MSRGKPNVMQKLRIIFVLKERLSAFAATFY